MDEITPYLMKILSEIKDAEISLKGTVVLKSQQIAGTMEQRQEPSLADRISKDRTGAEVQRNLELAKAGKPSKENTDKTDEMTNEVVSKYVDELVFKFLGKTLEELMGRILPVLEAIRRIVARWTLTESPLIANAIAGTNTISLYTTNRFNPGDQIMIKDGGSMATASVNDNVENVVFVQKVVDFNQIILTAPLKSNWTVAAGSYAVKTPHGNYVKNIFLGEPGVIPENSLPAITVNATTSHSDWYTTRATKERYAIDIGVFVEDSTDENAAKFHWDVTDLIVQGLKKNVYPLISDYQTTPVTQDIQIGDQYIKVADTSIFVPGCIVMVEDSNNMIENKVDCIIDATTLKLNTIFTGVFLASQTQVIRPNRFIFNSWPSDTKWGNIYKGSLLKSAVVSYFAEEIELQFNSPPWADTQLK